MPCASYTYRASRPERNNVWSRCYRRLYFGSDCLGLSIASLAHSNHQHTGGSGTTIQPTPTPTPDIYSITTTCLPLAVFNTASTAVTGTITIPATPSSDAKPASRVPITFTVTGGTSTTINPVQTDAAGHFAIDVTATAMPQVRLTYSIPGDSFGITVQRGLCVLDVIML